MARLSIYVPDALWDKVRATRTNLNPSQLVQAGLEALDESPGKLEFRVNRDDHAEVAQRARKRLVDEARKRHENGYETGLKMAAEKLNWYVVDLLAQAEWDFARWIKKLNRELAEGDVETIFEAIRASDSSGQLPPEFFYGSVDSAYEAGLVRALRDVWESVVAGSGQEKEGKTVQAAGPE